jgi:hypothetical protein
MRLCLSQPVPQIAEAARYLLEAASAHAEGDRATAEDMIRRADIPEIHRWLRPIWADSSVHLQTTTRIELPPISRELRAKARMPNARLKTLIHERDGYSCRFCGIPVIRAAVRDRIRTLYPAALRWGRKEIEQHSAFQAMWAQYDHILPHAHGGQNDLENVILTCAACNFGRAGYTLEEVGLSDPRIRIPLTSDWNGLESFK